jgi:UDP-N-acetylmuramate dehydrogenase
VNAAGNQSFRGKLLFDEPMSKHTSWREGGPADRYFVPADLDDLKAFLAALEPDIDVLWVGLGSNLLVRDAGIRGQVIAPLGALKALRLEKDGTVYAECGIPCSKLARFCQKQDLSGADFFAGIPGTVGGALTMNAGAFGGETWNRVERVVVINRRGEISERTPASYEVGYRHVGLPADEWFVAAYFRFAPRSEGEESNIRELLQRRNATQPIGQPSCGSVFKNPPGKHAAQLIESSGLKGYRLGSARVSDIHANFIISEAGTTARDVEALIEMIRGTVHQKFGVRLETEVRIVGEPA